MRLTLRTLLAWLDDTLPPSQVREIGSQVADSPYARELVERMRRVTRQRRLTVPKTAGPEAIDPNLVAGYLDNDLDAEQVAEVEKQCLNIDVCLAEVASVHQILSLLGQRAKVPREVKERMYQLVKGREAIPATAGVRGSAERSKSVVNPIQSWIERETISHSRREQFALVAGSLACFVVLGISTWNSLSPSPSLPVARVASPGGEEDVDSSPRSPDLESKTDRIASTDDDTAEETNPSMAKEPSETSANMEVAAAKAAPEGTQTEAARPDPSALPPGSVGRAEKGENVLLRFDEEKREWIRLTDTTPLNASDHLACLAPFRATLDLASVGLMMLEGAELRVAATTSSGQSRIEARKGRLLASKSPRGSTIAIAVGAKNPVILDLSGADSVGVERLGRQPAEKTGERPAVLGIFCQSGKLEVAQGEKRRTVEGPVTLTVDSEGTIQEKTGQTLPKWVGASDRTPAAPEIRDQFLRCFHPGRPVLAEIVTATEDSQEQIRRLAISALTTLGDLSYVMPLLDRKDAPGTRRDAIAAIREFISLGDEAARQAREQLLEEFGETTGPIVEKMLIGYTREEAAKPGLLASLVSYLEPDTPSVGVRELSLDNLTRLSGLDRQGYDPDRPEEGSGLANWKKLLNEGKILRELVPAPPSPASIAE